MPFNDQTGPKGMGPMTGRGNGFCSGNQLSGPSNRNFRCGNGGNGYGGGFPQGRNYGGARFQNMNGPNNFINASPQPSNVGQELESLELQKKNMEAQSYEIEKRINQLKKP